MEFSFVSFDYLAVVVLFIALISGIIQGIANKVTKAIAFIGAFAISYFFSGYISSAIISIEEVSSRVSSNSYGGTLIFIGTYIVVFLIALALILLLFTPISNFLLKGGPIRKTINALLGAIYGLFIGFLICSIYLVIIYFIASSNSGVNSWYLENLGYNDNVMTLSRWMLEFALNAIGKFY